MRADDPYRRIAAIYDLVIEPVQAGVRRVAFDLLSPEPDWQVLDVGCGTGTGLVAYVEAGCAASGVDVSEAMLAEARKRLGDRADLLRSDGVTLPFEDDRFDLVMTSMVLHEVAAPDREPFVVEMARVAKPNGRVMIIDFRFGSLRGWKGPVLRLASALIERLSGHHSGYESFKETGGVPGVVQRADLVVEQEKIVAGGNLAIYSVDPQPTT